MGSILTGIVILVVVTGCSTVQEKNVTADEISAEFISHQGSATDYSATVQEYSTDGNYLLSETGHIIVKRPDKYRIESFDRSGNRTGIRISDGSTGWKYSDTTNTYTQFVAEDRIFRDTIDFPLKYSTILKEYPPQYLGNEVVDGYSTYVLDVSHTMSFDPFPKKSRIWIDRDSWMIVRMTFMRENATAAGPTEYRTIDYQNISVNTGIPDSVFAFTVLKGAQEDKPTRIYPPPGETCEISFIRKQVGMDQKFPAYLPPGFNLSECDFTIEPAIYYHFHKSDPSGFLGFYQIPRNGAPLPALLDGTPVVVSIDGTNGEWIKGDGRNQLHWQDNNSSFWLIGTPEKEEMVKIARSLAPLTDELIAQIPADPNSVIIR